MSQIFYFSILRFNLINQLPSFHAEAISFRVLSWNFAAMVSCHSFHWTQNFDSDCCCDYFPHLLVVWCVATGYDCPFVCSVNSLCCCWIYSMENWNHPYYLLVILVILFVRVTMWCDALSIWPVTLANRDLLNVPLSRQSDDEHDHVVLLDAHPN